MLIALMLDDDDDATQVIGEIIQSLMVCCAVVPLVVMPV